MMLCRHFSRFGSLPLKFDAIYWFFGRANRFKTNEILQKGFSFIFLGLEIPFLLKNQEFEANSFQLNSIRTFCISKRNFEPEKNLISNNTRRYTKLFPKSFWERHLNFSYQKDHLIPVSIDKSTVVVFPLSINMSFGKPFLENTFSGFTLSL